MTPKLMLAIAAEFAAGKSIAQISKRRAMCAAQVEAAIRFGKGKAGE